MRYSYANTYTDSVYDSTANQYNVVTTIRDERLRIEFSAQLGTNSGYFSLLDFDSFTTIFDGPLQVNVTQIAQNVGDIYKATYTGTVYDTLNVPRAVSGELEVERTN